MNFEGVSKGWWFPTNFPRSLGTLLNPCFFFLSSKKFPQITILKLVLLHCGVWGGLHCTYVPSSVSSFSITFSLTIFVPFLAILFICLMSSVLLNITFLSKWKYISYYWESLFFVHNFLSTIISYFVLYLLVFFPYLFSVLGFLKVTFFGNCVCVCVL